MPQSTITNYSSNINSLYPVAGQDNDTQGFRDNFSNIKNAFEIASAEISNLQLNQAELLKDGATVTLQGDIAGGAAGANVILQSNTLTSAQGVLSVKGKGLSVGKGYTTSTVLTGVHGGTSFPYSNYFSVNRTNKLEIGSTFKFFNTSTLTFTVLNITLDNNTNTIYTHANFDPAYLTANGVGVGSSIEFDVAVRADGIYRGSIPPSSLKGSVGDTAGKMVPTSTGLFVATKDYDGTSTIWTKLQANAVTSALTPVVSPNEPYSGSTWNTTLDLSSSTNFYIKNPSYDLGINLINSPAAPYMMNVKIVVENQSPPVFDVDKIYVDGNLVTLSWTTSSGTRSTVSGVVSCFDFTIIGVSYGNTIGIGQAIYYADGMKSY